VKLVVFWVVTACRQIVTGVSEEPADFNFRAEEELFRLHISEEPAASIFRIED
jgi:hypothetical protein